MTNKNKLAATLFVLPAFILHFLVVSVPAACMVYFAFTKWSGLGKPVFNGLENFRKLLFEDTNFHMALLNNLRWLCIFCTVPIIIGLLVALLVIKTEKGQVVYRTIYFLPYVLATAVAGKIWYTLFNKYYGINKVFENLGLQSLADISWLGDGNLALYSVAYVDNWHWWGFVMVLLVAALQQVDPHLYEAADIEGANVLQKFLNVTIPQISATLNTILMITMIGAFLTFDYIYVMTQGGPGGATEIASTWIYKTALEYFNAGYANTMSLFICVVCAFIYFVFNALEKRGSHA